MQTESLYHDVLVDNTFPEALIVQCGEQFKTTTTVNTKQPWEGEVLVSHIFLRQRWLSQTDWGFFFAIEGSYLPSSSSYRSSTTATTNEASSDTRSETLMVLAFNKAATILDSKFLGYRASPKHRLRCKFKGELIAVDPNSLSQHRAYHWQKFFSHTVKPPKHILVVLFQDAHEVELINNEALEYVLSSSERALVRDLNSCKDRNEMELLLRQLINQYQYLNHMEKFSQPMLESLSGPPLLFLWRLLLDLNKSGDKNGAPHPLSICPMHIWTRAFIECDLLVLHRCLVKTNGEDTRFSFHPQLFSVFEEMERPQECFAPVPLTEADKELVILCDPSQRRTLGEREVFIKHSPYNWLSQTFEKPDSNSKISFALVYHSKEEGIFHYAGVLRDNPIEADESSEEEAKVEICFSFDTTGSMYGYLEEVRKSLKFLVQSLMLDMPSLRISIIAHGDYCDRDTKYTLKRLDFSNDPDRLCDFVQGVGATGGGDADECYELVLRDALSLSWTPRAMKALVVVGDAAPHKLGEESGGKKVDIDWREELKKLKELGVHVYGVQCGKNHDDDFYSTLANETDGAHLHLNQFKQVEQLVKGLCYLQATDYIAVNSAVSNGKAISSDIGIPDGGKRGDPLTSDPMLEAIHQAIHTLDKGIVEVNGKEYELSTTENAGCRFVQIGETTYIEQNKSKKDSIYADLANSGHKITWLIGRGKGWGLIVNDRIVKRPSNEKASLRDENLKSTTVVKDRKAFLKNWKQLTLGLLDGLLQPDRVYVAGGSVLNCLLADHRRWPVMGSEKNEASDLDVFICSNNEAEAKETMRNVITTLTSRLKKNSIPFKWKCRTHTVTLQPEPLKKIVRTENSEWECSICTFINARKKSYCSMCESPYKPTKTFKVVDITSNSGTVDSKLVRTFAIPPFQIILYLMGSLTELLCGFDLDCCTVAYDGVNLWAHQRALAAISRGVNIVDPNRMSPSYARRLLKYSSRGFATVVPGLSPEVVLNTKNYLTKVKDEIASINGVLWLISKEGKVIGEDWEGDSDREEEEDDDEDDENDDDEYSEERCEKTGRLLKKSKIRKRNEVEYSDDDYREERDEKSGLLVGKKVTKVKKKKEKRMSDEYGDDDYSEMRDEKSGSLRKREVANGPKAKKEKEVYDEELDPYASTKRKAEKKRKRKEDSDEGEDDDEYGEERDETTGCRMTKRHIRKKESKSSNLRVQHKGEISDDDDADDISKESKNKVIYYDQDTPPDLVVDKAEWHLRRSRFELSATFVPDWYMLASSSSVMPLLAAYNHWLRLGSLSVLSASSFIPPDFASSPNLVDSLLSFSPDSFSSLQHFDSHFSKVAVQLLNHATLHVGFNGKRYRLREIEFYYFGGLHKDYFTHCHEMQRYSGKWYFHQHDNVFRTGNFKGLDITFGQKDPSTTGDSIDKQKIYGGILIRAVEDLSNGSLLEGISVIVDTILKETQMENIDQLIEDPRFSFLVGDSGSLLLSRRPLYLSIEDSPRPSYYNCDNIFRCSRVGLSMRKMTGSEQAERYYTLPYRFMACHDHDISKWKRGQTYAVLSMNEQKLETEISSLSVKTGVEVKTVSEYLEWEKEGFNEATQLTDFQRMEKYYGNNFSQDYRKVCQFYGLCRARKEMSLTWWVIPEASWAQILHQETEKDYYKSIVKFVQNEVLSGKEIYPVLFDVFSAFRLTPFDSIRCVILGQDPYHTPGMAHGLCFSMLQKGKRVPPSLANIFKELSKDVKGFKAPDHGNLEKWALRGVLMLNTILTVEAHKPNSHKDCGWREFTDCVIRKISECKTGVVFLLWGEAAQEKRALIDESKHHILTAGHPSPLSPVPFVGCKCFSKTNEILKSLGKKPIDWSISPKGNYRLVGKNKKRKVDCSKKANEPATLALLAPCSTD